MDEYAAHCDYVEKAATPTELEDVLEAALGRHADASGLRSNANATP
jgi:hypothetical protein